MIKLNNITKKYNQETVLNIKELIFRKGEICGLIGNNGAGKTTLLRIITDLVHPTTGEVRSNGIEISKSELWKHYTSSYLDENFLIDFLTPEEFFYFIGNLYDFKKTDIDDRLSNFVSFFNDEILGRQKYIRDFSKGNRLKIGIASALLSNPEVLILDEPFSNLDPSSQVNLKQILIDYHSNANSLTIISSHDLNHITDISDRIILIEKGIIKSDFKKDNDSLSELKDYFSTN